MGLIGHPTPEWAATAHLNGEQKPISNQDYAGRWHVLYWYPLDFTWVCPTEIRGFQALLGEFEAESVAVIGASTDSFYSHQAWFRDRSVFPQEITHPVLADTAHRVARAFGVLKEDAGIAYRATVIVDDRGLVRSQQVNDLTVGRSPSEVLRTVQALRSGQFCGADWVKGQPHAAPPVARVA